MPFPPAIATCPYACGGVDYTNHAFTSTQLDYSGAQATEDPNLHEEQLHCVSCNRDFWRCFTYKTQEQWTLDDTRHLLGTAPTYAVVGYTKDCVEEGCTGKARHSTQMRGALAMKFDGGGFDLEPDTSVFWQCELCGVKSADGRWGAGYM